MSHPSNPRIFIDMAPHPRLLISSKVRGSVYDLLLPCAGENKVD